MKHELKIIIPVFAVILLLLGNRVAAQSHAYVVRDLESWSSLQLKFKVSKKLSFGLEESVRLDHNSTQFNQLFTNVHGAYKFNKAFQFKTGLRILNQSNDENQNTDHLRYFMSGSLKHNATNFKFRHRLMFTNKNELGLTRSEGDEHVKNLRFLTGLEYNIKNWKLDPLFTTEVFRRYKDGDSEWNKVRFKLSTDLKIKSSGKLEGFYAIEKEFGRSITPTNYILGISYSHTFKLCKNEK